MEIPLIGGVVFSYRSTSLVQIEGRDEISASAQ
jgi:hypothetical protein